MRWSIALFPCEANPVILRSVAAYMPVWVANVGENRAVLQTLWDATPQAPANYYTVVAKRSELSCEEWFLAQLWTVDQHFPNLTCFQLYDRPESPDSSGLVEHGFMRAKATLSNGAAFFRPFTPDEGWGIRLDRYEVDASRWRTTDDVYDGLLTSLGAPAWHGRNFNALHDSIVTGDINRAEPPFIISIRNLARAAEPARRFALEVQLLFRSFASNGCDARIEFQ